MNLIYKSLLIAASLTPSLASGVRRVQESQSPSLGDLFLAAAKNITNSTHPQYQKDSYLNADIKGGAIASLGDDMHKICIDHGYIESESRYNDGTTGEPQSYSVTCRFQTPEDFEAAYQVMRDAISAAKPTSTSFQTNINNYYSDVESQKAAQRGLEMLLHSAETLEEVMLVVPHWMNYVSVGYYPSTSSININLNKVYEYDQFNATEEITYPPDELQVEEVTELAVISKNPDGGI